MLCEVYLLSSFLAIPQTGNLKQVYHIFRYLKASPRSKWFFDPDYPSISEDMFY